MHDSSPSNIYEDKTSTEKFVADKIAEINIVWWSRAVKMASTGIRIFEWYYCIRHRQAISQKRFGVDEHEWLCAKVKYNRFICSPFLSLPAENVPAFFSFRFKTNTWTILQLNLSSLTHNGLYRLPFFSARVNLFSLAVSIDTLLCVAIGDERRRKT